MDAGQVVGAIMAFAILSIGTIIFDAFGDIKECDECRVGGTSDGAETDESKACEANKKYTGIFFVIAPIGILMRVFGIFNYLGAYIGGRSR